MTPGPGAPGAPGAERDPVPERGPLTRLSHKRRRKERGGLWAFLIAGALPVAAVVWFFLQPAADRDALLARIPQGWAGRAAHAGIAFGILIVLAWVALPAFHGAAGALNGAAHRLAQRRGFLRVLLYLYELLVNLLRAIVRLLYGLDIALILVCILVVLLLVVRILKPEFLPGFLPMLGR